MADDQAGPPSFRVTVPGICPRCGAKALYETVWKPAESRQLDPGGFVCVVHKEARTDHDCSQCGHHESSSTKWSEKEYPRGDGSPETLRKRALHLAALGDAGSAMALPESSIVPAARNALDEALALFPADAALLSALARTGGEGAPLLWQKAHAAAPLDRSVLAGYADCLAGLVWANHPSLRPFVDCLAPCPDPEARSWWWVDLVDDSDELGKRAMSAIEEALSALGVPDGQTVVVATDTGDTAFVRPPEHPDPAGLAHARLWCLAAGAAGILAHDYPEAVRWHARYVSLGPDQELAPLGTALEAALHECSGKTGLANLCWKSATESAQARGKKTLPEARPELFPAAALLLKPGQMARRERDWCPRCRGPRDLWTASTPESTVRMTPRADIHASAVWYGKTTARRCGTCGHGWSVNAARRTVETEF